MDRDDGRDDVSVHGSGRDSLDPFHRASKLQRGGNLQDCPVCHWLPSGMGVRRGTRLLGLALFEQVLVLAGNHAGWLCAAIFVTAGVYQLTSFKDVCLRHCRSPMSLLVHYTSFRGPGIDLRVGFHHGLYCVACCWGLMLILVAVGVMNIPAMAALTIVIFAEKLLRHGILIARLVGISFFGAAITAVIFPNLFPGLKPCYSPLP